MMTHYFKFAFPDDRGLLPNPCTYEVLGDLGLIETKDETLWPKLDKLAFIGTGKIERIKEADAKALIGERKPFEELATVPSFTEQTNWKSGFFDLPDGPGTCFLNPSLEWWKGSLHLFARRNIHSKDWLTGRIENNDLAIFRLNPDLSVADMIVPDPPNRHTREQWEDPRAFVADGKCYVSMATLIRGIAWKIRQCLVVMADDLSSFTVVSEPHFGGNHSTPALATGHEKNWTWFYHDGERHCVYSLNPLIVFLSDRTSDQWIQRPAEVSIPWKHGTLRGGTNPQLVEGEYLTFFHSSLPWKDMFGHCVMGTRRRYYMGAATFTASPPFRLTAITPEPLLTGSENDPRTLEGPPVVFPCGAKLIGPDWLVTMGINDEKCGWISIPQEQLKERMVAI